MAANALNDVDEFTQGNASDNALDQATASELEAVSVSANVKFVRELDKALKELVLLGFSSLEGGMSQEFASLANTAEKIGFTTLQGLILELQRAGDAYQRLDNDEQRLAVTTAIARLEFALSLLNFGQADRLDADAEVVASSTDHGDSDASAELS